MDKNVFDVIVIGNKYRVIKSSLKEKPEIPETLKGSLQKTCLIFSSYSCEQNDSYVQEYSQDIYSQSAFSWHE